MNTPNINIVGVCRFSMLGRGDWKAYRGQPDEMLEVIYAEKAAELFAPQRMEDRLATFEHLTLASMKAQSDPNFTFLVLSSDRMPAEYRKRLEKMCADVPQVALRFLPPVHVSTAQKDVMEELGIPFADAAQFRLDDDDSVSIDFVRRARRHSAAMWENANFAMSFSQQYYCVTDGPTEGIYNWHSPFFSAGAFVRHRDRSVFDFGHYAIQGRFVSVTDPHFPNIVTHRGDNDTPRHEAKILRKRGMKPASQPEIKKNIERHWSYLTEAGMKLAGLDKFMAAKGKKDQ